MINMEEIYKYYKRISQIKKEINLRKEEIQKLETTADEDKKEKIDNLTNEINNFQNYLSTLEFDLNNMKDDLNNLDDLDDRFFDEKYSKIPIYKLQLIAKNKNFQNLILSLNDFEFELYIRIIEYISSINNKWNRFDYNVINNLSSKYYKELINNLYLEKQNGNELTEKEIQNLSHILSKSLELSYQNIFDIKTKKDLENYEELKDNICNNILNNDKIEEQKLNTIYEISNLEKVKIAILEKYYNIDLQEAETIVNMFGKDLANTNLFSDESKKYIDEIIEIKEIYEKNDINDLKNKISSLKKHDLKSSIDFIEKIKAIFEQEYKKRTFSVQNAKKSTFRGTQIYEAGTDFSIISKYIGVSDENIKTKWNNLCKIVENTKELRFYTCVLYMTPENILNEIKDDTVLLGFSQGLKNFSIDAIYEHDAHSKYTGVDQIYHDYESSNYVFPSTLEANTNNEYNEMVINTLYANNKGQNIKLQPDYVIYIKKEDEDEKENNSRWEKTKKVADSFGIPIVVIDRKLVRQSEKEKIEKMYKECTKNLKIESLERIIKKMDHYIARYNQNDIKNIYDSCKNLLKNQKEKKIWL